MSVNTDHVHLEELIRFKETMENRFNAITKKREVFQEFPPSDFYCQNCLKQLYFILLTLGPILSPVEEITGCIHRGQHQKSTFRTKCSMDYQRN